MDGGRENGEASVEHERTRQRTGTFRSDHRSVGTADRRRTPACARLRAGRCGAGLRISPARRAEPFVLGLLGILAVIGVFSLFAGAIGLLRFSGRAQGSDLARGFMDSMGEGVLVADRDGRIVYANRAYADLIGAESERDVRAVERVFAGDPAASEAIYRLSQALRDGRSGEEEVRMPGRWPARAERPAGTLVPNPCAAARR